jgi:hypothetical protein
MCCSIKQAWEGTGLYVTELNLLELSFYKLNLTNHKILALDASKLPSLGSLSLVESAVAARSLRIPSKERQAWKEMRSIIDMIL